MILEVLEKQEPAVFLQKLFNTLTHYYEDIQSMSCAGGRPKPKSFKHTKCDKADAGGGESHEAAPAAAAEVAAGNVPPPQPPPAADSDAPATPATPSAKKPRKGRAGSGSANLHCKGVVVNKSDDLLWCDLVQCVGQCLNSWQANWLGPAGCQ